MERLLLNAGVVEDAAGVDMAGAFAECFRAPHVNVHRPIRR